MKKSKFELLKVIYTMAGIVEGRVGGIIHAIKCGTLSNKEIIREMERLHEKIMIEFNRAERDHLDKVG